MQDKLKTIKNELAGLINSHSLENGSNTPDFILAAYLLNCLAVFDHANNWNTAWHSKDGVPENWRENGPPAAVRAHDAGTTPTAAVNYAAIDRGWRMFCQSCGTDAPCPNCEVCGALLTMVQCNDTEAGTDEGLTDARWNALCRDISDRRGLKNGWWLIDDDVKQDIRAAWSRILYAPPASHAAESAAPDTLHFCAACWAGNHGSCSGDKCGCAHDSASVSTAQLDAEDQHRAAEPVEDVPAGYYSLEAVEKAIQAQKAKE